MKSILIIDASEIIATLFSEIFQRHGWKVATCDDAGGRAMDRLVGLERYETFRRFSHNESKSQPAIVRCSI